MIRISSRKILSSLLVSFCFAWRVLAGDGGIGVSLVSYTLDSSHLVDLGYTITINAEVTNFDSVPFSGTLNFGLRDSFQNLTSTPIFDQPPYSGDEITLNGHETVPAIFSVNISPAYFAPGPDVVVVWPICRAPIADSIKIYLAVQDPSGISGAPNQLFSYAIIGNRILLRNTGAQNSFQRVRILNDLGQVLVDRKSNDITEVSLPALAHGIYFCQLTTLSGTEKIIKFFY